MFEMLKEQPADPLLALIKLFKSDPRPRKLDLGVGVYRDETGATPIMRAMKAAEKVLLENQTTKTYLGPEGDMQFVELLKPIIFGKDHKFGDRLVGVQTPGGSGALRIGAELITSARPDAQLWISNPTWPNHPPMLGATGLTLFTYQYFNSVTQTLLFDEMIEAFNRANPGDVVLLHGCCHNPTGSDLSPAQWDTVAELLVKRGLIPFIDLAYLGLGDGLEADAYGVRKVLNTVEEALVAFSCDKNFALYRERTGVLYGLGKNAAQAAALVSHMAVGARVTWSMPPDHGAAAVRIILESEELTKSWKSELTEMAARIGSVRKAVANSHPGLAFIADQKGLFSNLSIKPEQVTALRSDHGVYMAGSGRINLAGLRVEDAKAFTDALVGVRHLPAV